MYVCVLSYFIIFLPHFIFFNHKKAFKNLMPRLVFSVLPSSSYTSSLEDKASRHRLQSTRSKAIRSSIPQPPCNIAAKLKQQVKKQIECSFKSVVSVTQEETEDFDSDQNPPPHMQVAIVVA